MRGMIATLLVPVLLVIPVNCNDHEQEIGVSLIQTKSILAAQDENDHELANVLAKLSAEGTGTKGAPSIDHAHLVCHHHGCEEVKAQLEVISQQIQVVNGKLKECSTTRANMEAALKQAAIQRAKAEADLKKCGMERQKLSQDLAQCGKDRAEAEKALAKCAAERGALEAELKQCAEVDRPNAEKALAKCASERKSLEKELALIVAKLKGGATTKPASRRRRRYVKKTKRSLAQVGSSDNSQSEILEGEDDEDTEQSEDVSLLALSDKDKAQLESRTASIQQRLSELQEETGILEGRLQSLMNKAVELSNKGSELANKAIEILKEIKEKDEEESGLDEALKNAETRSEQAKARLDKVESMVDKATREVEAADADDGAARMTLNKATLLQLKAQSKLIELVQKTQHLRHEALKTAHSNAGHKIGKVEALLEEKEGLLRRDDKQGCDELRAKVIRAKGKLETASGALANCLLAKKDIKAKMDKAEELRAVAQKSLDQCLETKAKLKTALNECHHRRDAAREKLEECLARKKVLKVKIAECHKKRDEARGKLAECLKAKKTLNEKIAAAKKKLGLVEVHNGWGASGDLTEALEALKNANAAFDENAAENIQIEEMINDAFKSIEASSAEEAQVLQQLKETSLDEIKNQGMMTQLGTTLRDAYEDLKEIDAKTKAAEQEAEASVKEADTASAALGSLLQRLQL